MSNRVHLKKPVQWMNRMKLSLCILFVGVLPFIANAQFIKIDIDIPAKTGVSDMEASDFSRPLDNKQNQQELEATYSLTISSVENMQVLAKLKHSDYLINESGAKVKLDAVLAFRNDGKNKPPKANASDIVQFPMSNSCLLIDNMKNPPDVLYAYLMIYTTIERPKRSGSTYLGDLKLTIEYN